MRTTIQGDSDKQINDERTPIHFDDTLLDNPNFIDVCIGTDYYTVDLSELIAAITAFDIKRKYMRAHDKN